PAVPCRRTLGKGDDSVAARARVGPGRPGGGTAPNERGGFLDVAGGESVTPASCARSARAAWAPAARPNRTRLFPWNRREGTSRTWPGSAPRWRNAADRPVSHPRWKVPSRALSVPRRPGVARAEVGPRLSSLAPLLLRLLLP